jgi:hypothetical protein
MKLSHSALAKYTSCGLRYKYHYINKLRQKTTSGALLFGTAIDKALGELLTSRSLDKAKTTFVNTMASQQINGLETNLAIATNVVYSRTDYDSDLIFDKDEAQFERFKTEYKIQSDKSLKQLTAYYRELKKEGGFDNLTQTQKMVYNYGHWVCLLNKGLYMLEGYNTEILPKVKKVHALQKQISLVNDDNDEVTGYIDAIIEWEDGKTYVIDHKTSTIEYEDDAAMTSQQLIIYYHSEKEEYKLSGVGFIVLYKQLNKNKVKTCSKCGFDGTGGRHKTCSNELEGVRCNGDWVETVSPQARIKTILNTVSEHAENLVISAFDKGIQGLKKEVFVPNLNSCIMPWGKCEYYSLCWTGNDSDLIKK